MLDWLAVIGGFALIGTILDFFIGKTGQKKVRDWLEVRWYQAAIAWDNFARNEANCYIRLITLLATA